jgi:hypothetical protein
MSWATDPARLGPSSPVYVLTYHLWSPCPVIHLSGSGTTLELGNGRRGWEQRARCGLVLYRAEAGKVALDPSTGLPWRHAAKIGRMCQRCAPVPVVGQGPS